MEGVYSGNVYIGSTCKPFCLRLKDNEVCRLAVRIVLPIDWFYSYCGASILNYGSAELVVDESNRGYREEDTFILAEIRKY
jgi:hypothetical protein